MRVSPNLTRRTNMIYKAVIRWTWHRIGNSKEKFENVYDAIKRYKELKKNKQVRNLSIVY